MGQRPHPFSHKLIDSTNGAFKTSGRGCFTKPGSKNGSCVGVFKAQKKGIYQFNLTGTQLLVNSKRSHFTGWIKKNGASLTGGFASAGDVTSIIGKILEIINLISLTLEFFMHFYMPFVYTVVRGYRAQKLF